MVGSSSDFFDEVTFFVEVKSAATKAPVSFVDKMDIHRIRKICNEQKFFFWTWNVDLSNAQNSRSNDSQNQCISSGHLKALENGSISEIKSFVDQAETEVFSFFSYDLKNELENLKSENPDHYNFPTSLMFQPLLTETFEFNEPEFEVEKTGAKAQIDLKLTLSREEYVAKILAIKKHIQFGDVYELNFCFEHVAEEVEIDPLSVFAKLQIQNPSPFAAYLKLGDLHCLCSSPERFIAKVGATVFSQPMKGTNMAIEDGQENSRLQQLLQTDPKERAENIMITDLVRNDLSKCAKPGSVKVDELCEVYKYGTVNQMISTVSCELREDLKPMDAVLAAFPMGSMTGAPKHRAMQLIDQYEDFSRGIFSGTIGRFSPNGDFDFNVVIRSLIYDEKTKRLSIPTGSAITIHSDPDKEYDECLLKAQRIKEILNGG